MNHKKELLRSLWVWHRDCKVRSFCNEASRVEFTDCRMFA